MKMKDDRCIYVILAKLGSAYYTFVSTFHSTKETLGDSYTSPSLESFCDSLIKEKYKPKSRLNLDMFWGYAHSMITLILFESTLIPSNII
jgi:hypothetical protein